MQSVAPPVSKALVLVCEKCGKRLDKGDDENPSRKLVSRLKKAAKKSLERGEVRALATSCMDICPDGQVSVAIASMSAATRFLTVDLDDVDETAQRILKEIKQGE
jgi:predicted metal-binding protein